MLDTSSVINGYVSDSSNHYTVPEVVEEARGLAAAASIGLSIDSGYLKIWEASSPSIDLVEEKLADIGGELSETDVRVIALALDLRNGGFDPVILTDDYGLQNLAKVLAIRYNSIATRGIMSVYQWKNQCPGCRREFHRGKKVCPVCGSKLKKIVVKRAC